MQPPAAEIEQDDRQFPFWRSNVQALSASTFLAGLGFTMAWPFLPLVLRGLGVVDHLETWLGYMMLAFYLVGTVMNPVWGGLADHFGRKIMVLRASFGMGLMMIILPFATTPLLFALGLMLVGVFNGSLAAVNALLAANTPIRRLGSAMTMSQMGGLVGRTIGPAAGAAIAALLGHYHWIFWVSGTLQIAGGLVVIPFVHEVKQLVTGKWRPHWIGDLVELLKVPAMAPLFFLSFIFSVLWNGNVPILSVEVIQLLAGKPAEAGSEAFWIGAVAMALTISSLAVRPFWGRMLVRHDPARILAFTTGAAALAHVPLLFIQTPLQLVFARIAFGMVATAMQPAIVRLLKDHAPKGMDARAISYGSSFQFIAMGLAPFAAGLIGPTLGLPTYFGLTVVLTLCSLALWQFVRRRAGI